MEIDFKDFLKSPEETEEEYAFRVCKAKDDGEMGKTTWQEVADLLNAALDADFCESFYRKRYVQLKKDMAAENVEYVPQVRNDGLQRFINQMEMQKQQAADQRTSFRKMLRNESRRESLCDILRETVVAYEHKPMKFARGQIIHSEKAVYALLGDLHYGIAFRNSAGEFSPEIARERLVQFTNELVRIGEQEGAMDCYVSFIGDLISGNIHSTIQVENRENVVKQVVNISNILSDVLLELSGNFANVYVNNVNGNHSRITPNSDDAPNGERLDALVPVFCKLKLQNIENVHFEENEIDETIGSFDIYGKLYTTVHGDMDRDMKRSRLNIERLIGRHVDVYCAGHMHVFKTEADDCLYVQNGSLCGSGDEYTIRKRLFGKAEQTVLVCSEGGVDAIYPVVLE